MIARGTPIAVVAPSGAFDPERLGRGLEIIRAHGHDPRPLPGIDVRHRYLAGTDEHRLAHLVEALTSPGYGAVWIARGGYGITRLLHRVPWDELPPRPVIGFSDVTALHAVLRARGLPAVHGPVVHSLPITDDVSIEHLFALLAGEPLAPLPGESWVGGVAEGPVVGGNLCLLASTCGTPWQLDAGGCILVLEDVGEAAYRVDRAVQQLVSAGVLDEVAGVALGEFVSCNAPEHVDEALREHLEPLGVPVVARLPIGHGAANRAFAVGGAGRIEAGYLHLAC